MEIQEQLAHSQANVLYNTDRGDTPGFQMDMRGGMTLSHKWSVIRVFGGGREGDEREKRGRR